MLGFCKKAVNCNREAEKEKEEMLEEIKEMKSKVMKEGELRRMKREKGRADSV